MSDAQAEAWKGKARELLPCWFADRILAEPTRFALLLDTRHVLVIDGIRAVRQSPGGDVWLDVELVIPHRKENFPWGYFPVIKASGAERAICSIAASHVVAAVEVDTWELPPLEPDAEH